MPIPPEGPRAQGATTAPLRAPLGNDRSGHTTSHGDYSSWTDKRDGLARFLPKRALLELIDLNLEIAFVVIADE